MTGDGRTTSFASLRRFCAIAPTHHGFGTSLLKAAFADVRVDYASADNICCNLSAGALLPNTAYKVMVF
jgi:hypothetical protein